MVGPHSPDHARPISKFTSEIADSGNGFVDISTALIGSCTNSSDEDMSRAADVADQACTWHKGGRTPIVTPGSEQVRATIERDGQMQSLQPSTRLCWQMPGVVAMDNRAERVKETTRPIQ